MATLDLYDTGALAETPDGWFVLNPAAPFQLHVAGISVEQASRLKRALEKGYGLVREAEQPALTLVGAVEQFRCREIDEFTGRYQSLFQSAVQGKLDATPDWPSLVAKGDEAANRRRRIRNAAEAAVIAENGEAFRYLPSLLDADIAERRQTVVEMLCHTYVMAGYSAHRSAQRSELRATIRGWLFTRMPKGCCPGCRSLPEQSPAVPWPIVPQHAGCGCTVHPILS